MDILYCGICHSDLNFVGGEFGPLPVRPLVPGHGIVGRVTEVGAAVTRQGFQGRGPEGHLPGMGTCPSTMQLCRTGRQPTPPALRTWPERPGGAKSCNGASCSWR
ncbi:alcohol dehydrogenase catalytic domain-containing protein [Streptomyces sp. NPDC058385]|uniref:alcohol dehydrogenase catalytic domain-containing protein n=1 Tax=Streptomyces sp. NPDC058385 TaxID=3346473 RepID=UPI0036532E9B